MQKLLLRAGASDYLEAETEEMMDMESGGDSAEPVAHSSPRRSPLIPRTPPRVSFISKLTLNQLLIIRCFIFNVISKTNTEASHYEVDL